MNPKVVRFLQVLFFCTFMAGAVIAYPVFGAEDGTAMEAGLSSESGADEGDKLSAETGSNEEEDYSLDEIRTDEGDESSAEIGTNEEEESLDEIGVAETESLAAEIEAGEKDGPAEDSVPGLVGSTSNEASDDDLIPIEDTDVQLCTYAFYTGKAVCPDPVISYKGKVLRKNKDYAVRYSNNVNPGKAVIRMIGIGLYDGSVSGSFRIINVALSTKSAKYPYTGTERRPAPVITGAPYDLVQGTDYNLDYRNNKDCGNATILIEGTGGWYGTISASFTLYLKKIELTSVTSPMNLRVLSKWTPDVCTSGYQLQYEIDGKANTVTVEGGSCSQKTLFQLPQDKVCSVKVRSYLDQNGKRSYSAWSDAKSVTIRYLYWNVTQYQSVTGKQAMIYAITDRYNKLILIDGGYDKDADQIRKIIKEHNNRVYAWILTHPHGDHIGAFNKIMASDSGIKVDRIFATSVNSKRYRETAKAAADVAAYDAFCKVAAKLSNVRYLKENDTFSSLGLSFKVLHGWDQNVDALEESMCNNGSLMFKVQGKARSMLFCADTEDAVEQSIRAAHGDELPSDFVQCGHHGFWGLSDEFYDLVDPETAFIDAPAKYFVPDEKYKNYELMQHFSKRGTTVYRYDGKTHRVRIT